MTKLRNIAVAQDLDGNVWYMEWPKTWKTPDGFLDVQVEYRPFPVGGMIGDMKRGRLLNFYRDSDVIETNAIIIEAYDEVDRFRYGETNPINAAPTAQEIAEAAPALMVERTVVVRFHYRSNVSQGYGNDKEIPSQKEYHYIWDGPKIEPGSIVVVKVPSSGFVAATVIKELYYLSEQSTKYIVQVVDTSAYEKRAEKAKLRGEILKQLREAAKKSDEIVKFQLLAAGDPKIAALLDQLQRI